MKNFLNNIKNISVNYQKLKYEIDNMKVLIGKQLTLNITSVDNLNSAEFKVFSQWGDDGIIQYLIRNIDISSNYFVEFGVENYTESNTRFLLINNNWSGLVLDGSLSNINYIKNDQISWRYDLNARHAFVTCENINKILDDEKVPNKIGILHIDVDGNDYWIWSSIERVIADIVIVEYNSLFGCERSITIPYKDKFYRTEAHFSNLYFGASLTSLCDLATIKGYSFVGCNLAGNNAYFILTEKLGSIKSLNVKEGFIRSKFRESRTEKGELSYLNENDRLELIKGLEVYNTRTKKIEKI